MSQPYAEDVRYWKTSKSSADKWMERTANLIADFGGKVTHQGSGIEGNRAAFMIQFEMDSDTFKVVWPALESMHGDDKAARVQAATMLHHDVKAKCVSAEVLGARKSFFGWLALPDGRTLDQLEPDEVLEARTPALLLGE